MAEPVIIEFVPAPVVDVLFPDAVKGDPGDPGASGWDLIAGKPSEFPPEGHTHAIADTTGLQAALAAKVDSSILETLFSSRFISYTDCIYDYAVGLAGIQVAVQSFTSASIASTNISGHSGAITFTIATTINSTAGVVTARSNASTGINLIELGAGKAVSGILLSTSSNLSTVGTPYTIRAGFSNYYAGESNGVFFRYDQTQSVWQAVCKVSNVETVVNTAVTVAVSTTYNLRIEVNADGTSAAFYVDGILHATITTNIPIGNSNRVHGQALITRISTGASTSNFSLMRAYWIIED